MTAWAIRLVVGFVVLGATACERLDPAWCEMANRCAQNEFCDRLTNTCRPHVKLDQGQPRELIFVDGGPENDGVTELGSAGDGTPGVRGDGQPDHSTSDARTPGE